MPRLFTGFPIPSPIGAQLASLRGGLTGAKWVEPQDYHVTLRFFGDMDGGTARAIDKDLFELALESQIEPFALALDEIAAFGRQRPHALIARVKPSAALTRLQQAHEALARRNGLPPEPRKFTPHVTLARLRGVEPQSVANWLEIRAFPLAMTLEADHFALFSARDSVGGGPYHIEAIYPLGMADQPSSSAPMKGNCR